MTWHKSARYGSGQNHQTLTISREISRAAVRLIIKNKLPDFVAALSTRGVRLEEYFLMICAVRENTTTFRISAVPGVLISYFHAFTTSEDLGGCGSDCRWSPGLRQLVNKRVLFIKRFILLVWC